jgi:transposase
MGHTVRIIPPQRVKPYLKGQKNDANDAEAICEAISRPGMRFVAVKTERQQTLQAEHRVRARLIRARTALSNEIRGLLAEFGLILPVGIRQLRKALPEILSQQEQWDDRFIRLLSELSEELKILDERVARHDGRLQQAARDDVRIKRLLAIEGWARWWPAPWWRPWVMADSSKVGGKWRLIWVWFPGSTPAAGKNGWGHISKRGTVTCGRC